MLGPFDDDDEDFCKPSSASNLANVFNTRMSSEADNESLLYVPPKQTNQQANEGNQPTFNQADSTNPNMVNSSPATACVIAKIVTTYQLLNNQNVPKGKLGLALLKITALPDVHKMVIYTGTKKTIATATTNNPNVHITLQENNYINMYDDAQQNWSMMFSSEKDFNEFVAEIKKCGLQLKKKEKEEKNSEKSEADDADSKKELLKRMAKMGQAIICPPKAPSTSEITSDSSDSNNEKKSSHKKSSKPSPAARKTVTIKSDSPHSPVLKPRTLMAASHSNLQIHTNNPNVVNVGGVNYLYLNGQLIPVPLPEQTFPTLSQQNLVNPYSGTDPLSLLFAENRMHNSEVRINVNRMSDKLERLMDKFNGDEESLRFKIREELRSEYESKLNECYTKINNLQSKIADVSDLTDRLKTHGDELQSLKLENAALKSMLKHSEDARKSSENEKTAKEEEFARLKLQIDGNESKLTQLEEFCETVASLKSQNEDLFETIQLLEQQLGSADEKNNEIDHLNTEIAELRLQKSNTDSELDKIRSDNKEQTDSKVKTIMNELFKTLTGQFASDGSYTGGEISSAIARTIKDTTIRMLEH